MEQYVGLDVSLGQTSVCVVDGSGKALWQGKCASTPEALAATIRAKAPTSAQTTSTVPGGPASPPASPASSMNSASTSP